MKKIIMTIVVLSILLTGLCAIPASAAGASLSFSQSTLRAGDTFSVTLSVSLSGALTVDGSFSFSGPISLNSITGSVGTMDQNGNKIFIDLGNTAISGTKAVAVANFTVNSAAQTGETISVSFTGNYSNLDGDYAVSGSGSQTVAAPLSTNCNLNSLTLGNATLSPAFSAATTSYSAGEVPFSVSTLDVKAAAEDAKAKVSVSGKSLSVGSNTVKITVTAENGATKTYQITVTRQQDPNYVPSSDTSLAHITVDGFLLSPPFSNGVNTYVVWLPYETENIAVTAAASDSKAGVAVTGGQSLTEGDNQITITCTAEDGSTKDYYVIAKRATKDGSQVIPETQPETEPTEETLPEPTPEPAPEATGGVHILIVVLLCILSAAIGGGIVYFLLQKNILKLKKHNR